MIESAYARSDCSHNTLLNAKVVLSRSECLRRCAGPLMGYPVGCGSEALGLTEDFLAHSLTGSIGLVGGNCRVVLCVTMHYTTPVQ